MPARLPASAAARWMRRRRSRVGIPDGCASCSSVLSYFCAANHIESERISSSVYPLAIRPMTVDGLAPVRNAVMFAMNSSAFWPLIFGTGVSAAGLVAWQPVQAAAPVGGSGESAHAAFESNANAATVMADNAFIPLPPVMAKRRPVGAAACRLRQAICSLWFLSGKDRMRVPVALAYAFNTAGAATQMVGSPTPPHGPLPPV